MQGKRALTIFIILICSISSTYAAIQTIKPHAGAIQYSFTDQAKTRLEQSYVINMPLSGKLERINLEPGDKITQGQLIAQLVEKPLQQKVVSVKGQLRSFHTWYLLRSKILTRDRKLRQRDFITQQEYEQSQAYVQMLAAQTTKTKADLAVAEYNLKQAKVYAPITGLVLNRYQQGDTWLPEGTKLLEIGNLKELDVICDVLTQNAQLLHVGDPVILSSTGTTTILHGKVTRIDPAGFTKKSSLGVDEQRVNIIIKLTDPAAANLGVGYRLQAKFLVGTQQKNALIVPRFSVLQDPQGNYYVFIMKDKKLQKQIVQIGIKTDTEISIIKGLSSNATIVSQPTADMH